MNALRTFTGRFLRDESGQMLPLVAVMLTALLGISGMVIDVGHSYYCYRDLQATTNAAALAGAASLTCPVTSVCSANSGATAATAYSAVKGGANVRATLPNVAMVSGYPKQKCLTTLQAQGMACVAPTYANAVQVKQTVALPLYFAALLGKKTLTLTTSATASMRGASPTPYNVAIVLDSTLSMNIVDSNCGDTQMNCALSGVRTLLKSLTPCAINQTTCQIAGGAASNSVDRVALFTFPNVVSSTASIDSSCTTQIPGNYQYYSSVFGGYTMLTGSAWSGVPTAWPYTSPTAGANKYTPVSENLIINGSNYGSNTVTYQLTPFLSDYKTTPSGAALNPASAIVKAAGGVSGCTSMLPSNYDGNFGTYYAGALYAAQSALVAQQAANPGSSNVIILLSDGDANVNQLLNNIQAMPAGNGSGYYPSYFGECGQGVAAASAATAAGTRVYTVAYGSPPTGCITDVNAGQYPNIAPCVAMSKMASAPQYFFSDYNQTGSNSTCVASQSVTALSDIFTQIANDLTTARLIPDSTT